MVSVAFVVVGVVVIVVVLCEVRSEVRWVGDCDVTLDLIPVW